MDSAPECARHAKMRKVSMESPEDSEVRPAMTCARCGIMSTLLFDPEPAGYVDGLPDPFNWQCRFCGHQQYYPKSAIQTMTADQFAKPFKMS
jgi:hypothetical protein